MHIQNDLIQLHILYILLNYFQVHLIFYLKLQIFLKYRCQYKFHNPNLNYFLFSGRGAGGAGSGVGITSFEVCFLYL